MFVARFSRFDRWSHEAALSALDSRHNSPTTTYTTVHLRDVIANLVELRASSSAKWSGLRMWLRLWITRQCYPQAWFMPLCGASPS
jgi:hypothetical protein